MCLKQVLPEKPEPRGRGWKVFRKAYSPVSGDIVPQDLWPEVITRCAPYLVGTWYEAFERVLPNSAPPEALDYQEYVSGFHIVLDRDDAEAHVLNFGQNGNDVIREVEYEGAHTLGLGNWDFQGRQVIAKRMRILPETEIANVSARDKV